MYLSTGLAPVKHKKNSEHMHTESDKSSGGNHNPRDPGMTTEKTPVHLGKDPDRSLPNHIT